MDMFVSILIMITVDGSYVNQSKMIENVTLEQCNTLSELAGDALVSQIASFQSYTYECVPITEMDILTPNQAVYDMLEEMGVE